jgi:two-component system, NarL family, sensor kinase
MKKSIPFIICFVFFLPAFLLANSNDSLWSIWNNKNIHDSLKINAISDIAWNYCGVNPDSAYYWASIELSLAKKFNKRNLVIDALNTMGTAQRLKGNYLLAVEDYQEILKCSKKITIQWV